MTEGWRNRDERSRGRGDEEENEKMKLSVLKSPECPARPVVEGTIGCRCKKKGNPESEVSS